MNNFLMYLNAVFVGQELIKRELPNIVQSIINGENYNLLFRAPSGYGKTWLSAIVGTFINIKLDTEAFYNYLCRDDIRIVTDRRIHILDEVHKIREPEFLYPLMDSGNLTFILCTNEYDELKEPLNNRCINFVFEEYNYEEIRIIVKNNFLYDDISLSIEYTDLISTYVRNSPREIKLLCKRLSIIMRVDRVPRSLNELKYILEETLGMNVGGLSELDNRYLDFLKINGTAGLETISLVINVPKSIIRREIEPLLIKRGLIRITTKGRTYVN